MKDYTISHPCGLEQVCMTKKEATQEAKNHFIKCKNHFDKVYIDEYDNRLGELSGKYWTVAK